MGRSGSNSPWRSGRSEAGPVRRRSAGARRPAEGRFASTGCWRRKATGCSPTTTFADLFVGHPGHRRQLRAAIRKVLAAVPAHPRRRDSHRPASGRRLRDHRRAPLRLGRPGRPWGPGARRPCRPGRPRRQVLEAGAAGAASLLAQSAPPDRSLATPPGMRLTQLASGGLAGAAELDGGCAASGRRIGGAACVTECAAIPALMVADQADEPAGSVVERGHAVVRARHGQHRRS